MTALPRLPMALTVYGFPHKMGYLPTKAGERPPAPMSVIQVMDAARDFGLTGVEFPLPSEETLPTAALRDALAERDLQVVIDSISLLDSDVPTFQDYLRRSAAAGAKVVRSTLSSVLCGDRRKLDGGWEARLTAIAARLREVLPVAEELGLAVAMENHQDATTDDLLRLAEMSGNSPAYGITLDAGNPLAVGEEPVEAARRMAPFIRHIHLKDYTIHFAPEGYRLVRCAAGDGVVDFPAILAIVRANGYDVLPGIEIAAQQTRTIPLLEPDWWDCYPPVTAKDFTGALRVLWAHGRPMDEPYPSAWERGEDSATVSAEEWDIVERSVAYFRSL